MKITALITTKVSLCIASMVGVQAHLIDTNGTHKSSDINVHHPAIGLELPIALLIIALTIYQIVAKKRLKKYQFAALILILSGSLLFV